MLIYDINTKLLTTSPLLCRRKLVTHAFWSIIHEDRWTGFQGINMLINITTNRCIAKIQTSLLAGTDNRLTKYEAMMLQANILRHVHLHKMIHLIKGELHICRMRRRYATSREQFRYCQLKLLMEACCRPGWYELSYINIYKISWNITGNTLW